MHEDEEMTPNERAWLHFLRDIADGRDPAPTLRRVQLLRRLCAPNRPAHARRQTKGGLSCHR
ncbi:hypothetical protein [Salipiger bermudensis]|uniref:hypothetical protein n=1 Tax=Salipiger bermudensis TaxID=344736 RepID=UPI001A8ED550|nr:hypothetical protein [Salipiger bermudensis]MBN9676341.1 hypothetical protein [Salipiger bermudensis]